MDPACQDLNPRFSSPGRTAGFTLLWTLVLSACLVPAAALAQDPEADEDFIAGQVRLLAEQVDRTSRRLRPLAGGGVGDSIVSEDGLFKALRADLLVVKEAELTEDLILIVENRLHFDSHDPTRVNSERYGVLDNRLRADLGGMLGEATLLDFGGFWDVHREDFNPLFRSSSRGFDVTLDRAFTGFRNLTGTLEYRRTTFDDVPLEDHDQIQFSLGWFQYGPETLDTEILPHPIPLETRRPGALEYAGDMEFDRSRDQFLDLGAGQIDRATREPEPVGRQARLFRNRIGQREGAFGASLAYTRRDGDSGGATSFDRGTLETFVRRATDDDVIWTLKDRFAYTDHDSQALNRFLFDRFDNRLSLERADLEKDSSNITSGAIESILGTDQQTFDTHRLVLDQYSAFKFGRRYGSAFRLRAFKRFNQEPSLDYQDYEGFKTRTTYSVEFGPKSGLDLSFLYERIAVQGLQTEFDSTYAQRTAEIRYRRKVRPGMRAEVGLRDETETHEVFVQNNRDEQVVFVDFVVELN